MLAVVVIIISVYMPVKAKDHGVSRGPCPLLAIMLKVIYALPLYYCMIPKPNPENTVYITYRGRTVAVMADFFKDTMSHEHILKQFPELRD